MSRYSHGLITGIFAAAAITFSAVALAAPAEDLNTRVEDTLNHFYAQNGQNRDLVSKAAAVLVFPSVTKAGAGVGGEYGKGELRVGTETAGYYKVTGASIGATLGAARHSEVIVFKTAEARDKFISKKDWTIGADLGVAVAKTGAGRDYDTETLQKPVVAFVFGEKGLIADASIEGAKLTRLPKAASPKAE
jgi:lipid-binding SYLF domain-containing protein